MLGALEGGCEILEETWGTFVVNPEFYRIHEANCLWLRALPPGGLAEALARADAVFRPPGIGDRTVIVEDSALAERLRPAMQERGFTAKRSYVMVAQRPPSLAGDPDIMMRPVRDQATRDDHDAIAGLIHEEAGFDHETSHQFLALHWRRVAALGREVTMAYLEGRPAGYVLLDDIDGVGVIQEVATAPDMRKRGVAATLTLFARKRAEQRGLDPLALTALTEDTVWKMYERLGFDRAGALERFLRPGR